ncbi:type II secretion system F family protein [Solimonas marina]|uniref:Type II secretion system protein GspF domain-containing protein n=1 Tax=Solimonas marina TaxID=2714601 RepID=A0A969W6E1_9GAMM|nr:type II secretion system F family protein [Solimonas marina]NKF21422.1 hypothetical protein [Solimonas marina]
MSLVIVALVALLLIAAAGFLVLQATAKERQEDADLRLRVLGGQDEAAAALLESQRERELRNPILRWSCHLIWRTGVDLEPAAVRRILLGGLLLAIVVLLIFGVLAGIACITLAFIVGWLVLTQMAARRRIKIISQFPSFLESVIRVLVAGNTLEEALSSASREAPEPIRPLFINVSRQVRLGAPLEAVLMQMAEIHDLRDLKVMALAASINRKFGGSMRNVLRSLISGIRTRENAARELRALTAETRFSAVVLSVIPTLLVVFIIWRNPGYYTQIWADHSGRLLLCTAIILQVAGVFVIWRMMKSTETD